MYILAFVKSKSTPKKLQHKIIGELINLDLSKRKDEFGIYQLLKFNYFQDFFAVVRKSKGLKKQQKGRPKRITVIEKPKRLVIVPIKAVVDKGLIRYIPTSVDNRGRTIQQKASSKPDSKAKTPLVVVNLLNDRIRIQHISEFKLARHKNDVIYFAYGEIRLILNKIYKYIRSQEQKHIYKKELKISEICTWLAEAVNWRLSLELAAWKSYRRQRDGKSQHSTGYAKPKFSARNIQDMLNSSSKK